MNKCPPGSCSHILAFLLRARYTPVFKPESQHTWNEIFLVSEEMGVREKKRCDLPLVVADAEKVKLNSSTGASN